MKLTALAIFSTLLVTPSVAAGDVTVLGIVMGAPLRRPAIEGPFSSTLPSPGVRSFVVPLAANEKRDFIKYPALVVRVSNEKVEGLTIFTRGAAVQDAALRELREKFGEPTRVETTVKQNPAGAPLPYYNALWSLSDTEIRFEGITSDPETGAIHVTTGSLRPQKVDQAEIMQEADPHL